MKKISTIICFLLMFSASAQWTSDTAVNTLVAESGELDVMARGTTDGQTYVVFWKNVDAPTNIELRLQVVDADGNQTLGEDGILVSDQLPMSSFTVLMTATVDASDNLYIGTTGTGGGEPAYVFKMDIDGNHLWGTSGIQVGSGNVVTVLPLSDGNAIVGWLGSAGGLMQKFDENGDAIWDADMPIEQGGSATVPANLFELSDGDYIVVFHSLLFGINSNLYAQRYDMDGNAVWADPVQLADRATAFNRSYPGVQDGDVVYMGYFAAEGLRFDSFLQRIDPDGNLPWGINGSDFDVNQTNYEMETEIAFESGSQHIWAVSTYRNENQSERGEYVQKFDKDSGARELSENAKEVFSIGSNKSHSGALRLRNGTPLFVMLAGENNGVAPVTLSVVNLDQNGEFAWAEETRPVATYSASKNRISFTKEGNMQNVAVFSEDKGDGMKIYAQNVMDDTAGIDYFSDSNVSFVNPIKNEMLIKSNSSMEAISIYNVLGQQIINAKFNRENQIEINTENWTSGIYFMNISTNEGVKKGIKLIKQ
ncbi:T9SS type A sorting domain-containing protein [Aequorivita marina]|uniref:T9SS type A sorting domain-containing protein n=1 Tax=Aequorivita marina TaxID=3073654 RepID=UPI00287609AF|nr:T9SS type A sorting domain-containing protein [Aequorivita sp. S2608]MDS1297222.1 T9SS type A sorting domain-containing protein [Aequorivita sp. S2608]